MNLNSKIRVLAFSIGLIYIYFGVLKMFPNASPAEELGINTVSKLCCGIFSESFCIYSLAILEVGIGMMLWTKKFLKIGVIVGLAHLFFTFAPLLMFPQLTFEGSVFTPSILGQYIFKNIIIMASLWLIYPTKSESDNHDYQSSKLINHY